jgi:hypothetical protein
MPDVERVFDQTKILKFEDCRRAYFLAETPIERARAEGFIAGKNYARWEILVVLLGTMVLIGLSWVAWQYLQ